MLWRSVGLWTNVIMTLLHTYHACDYVRSTVFNCLLFKKLWRLATRLSWVRGQPNGVFTKCELWRFVFFCNSHTTFSYVVPQQTSDGKENYQLYIYNTFDHRPKQGRTENVCSEFRDRRTKDVHRNARWALSYPARELGCSYWSWSRFRRFRVS